MVDQDKQLADRIRKAGPRESVPEERAARVRGAIQSEWRAQVDSRRRDRRRRILAWGATAATAAVLIFAFLALRWPGFSEPHPIPPTSFGQVSVIRGNVWSSPGSAGPLSDRVLVEQHDLLTTGVDLITSQTAQVAILLEQGGSIRLSPDAELHLAEARRFVLQRGAIYVDSVRFDGRSTDPLEIETAYGTATNLGTQFEVRVLSDSAYVRVRSGRVQVTQESTRVEIGAEEQIDLRLGESPVRTRIDSNSADWDWISGSIPIMQIEGRSLGEFLRWVARERGLQLELGPTADLAELDAIELRGSIEGMSLDQALDSVLLTSRWTYRRQDGLLLVEPMAENR